MTSHGVSCVLAGLKGKYGAYLLACYDPDREEYQSVCKIGTGFTDEVLLSFWTELKERTVDKRPRCDKQTVISYQLSVIIAVVLLLALVLLFIS